MALPHAENIWPAAAPFVLANYSADADLQHFARTVQPLARRLDAALRLRGGDLQHDPRCAKALAAITPGAASRLICAGRPVADFFEQAAYNSRRLAKLNVAPGEVVEALKAYDREMGAALGGRADAAFSAARQNLHFRTLLTLNNAYYQVREAETQAFYGLVGAEVDAAGLDDLLQRFITILTRTFRAQAGRLIPLSEPPSLDAAVLKRLSRPLYVAAGNASEKLVLDPAMRSQNQSYWSIPYYSEGRLAGLIQLGFSTPYRWLPRELDLLHAFAGRCLRAVERARLIEDLAAREAQVRALANRLLEAEREERGRISRELHDEAGQSMLFLRLHLEMIEKTAPASLRPKVAEAREVAENIIGEIRRLVTALGPAVVEELGLPAAIRHLSERFRKLHAVKVKLRLTPYGSRPPRAIEAAVYRIVQECYQNIAKHAAARHVNLSLRSTDKVLELNVKDDGAGFDADSAAVRPNSFGVKGMRERVALLGGRFEIRSRPGRGTQISVRIPIPQPSSV